MELELELEDSVAVRARNMEKVLVSARDGMDLAVVAASEKEEVNYKELVEAAHCRVEIEKVVPVEGMVGSRETVAGVYVLAVHGHA